MAPCALPGALVTGLVLSRTTAPPDAARAAVAALVALAVAGGATALVVLRRGVVPSGPPGSGGARVSVAALVVVSVVLGLAGLVWGSVRSERTAPPPLQLPGAVEGTVALDEVPKPADDGGWRVRAVAVRLTHASGGGVPAGTRLLLRLGPERDPGSIGSVLEVEGTLRPAAGPSAPGWWRRVLARERIAASLRPDRSRIVGRRRGLVGIRDRWRAWAIGAAGAGLDGDRGAIVRGMLLGGGSDLSSSAADAFREAGIWHLLAVSGQNVTVVALAALVALRWIGVARRSAVLVALGLIGAYCLACDPGPSVARAGIMGAVALLAELASAPSARWYLLLVALAALLAYQPRAATDPGLQLSFAAVVGLFALAGPISARLRPLLPNPIAELAAMAASAGIATAPVLAWHFERLSLVGLALNVVAVPLAGPIVVVALCALAAAAIAQPLSILIAWPAGAGAAVLLAMARVAAAVPGASAPAPAAAALPLALGAVGIGLALRRRRRSRSGLGPIRRAGGPLAALGLGLVALVALHGLRAGVGWPTTPTLVALDVGQGDATLLQSPGGAAGLVDAGPPGAPAPAARGLAHRGVDSLAFVALTHPARDHDGGLDDVLGRASVERVLVPDPAAPAWSGVREIAHRHGVPVQGIEAGAGLRLGAWRVEALWPPAGLVRRVDDPNDASLVLHARADGADVLLSGDAESPQLAAARLPARVGVLKVGHHGSSDPGIDDLLARLRPRLALISAGAGNRHGHPHPQTLAALGRAGVAVLRTDLQGDLVVRPAPVDAPGRRDPVASTAGSPASARPRAPGEDARGSSDAADSQRLRPRGVRASRRGRGGASRGLRHPRRGSGARRARARRARRQGPGRGRASP